MKKVFSYSRFSSKRQEQGDSIRRQQRLAADYCARHGLVLEDKTYEDLHVSAWKGDNVRNGALGAFLRAVDDGLIPSDSMILVEHLDRVTRAEPMVAVEIFTGIVNRGLTLVTLKDEQVYSRESIRADWSKLLVSIVMMVQANDDNEKKSIRVREGIAQSRANGTLWRTAPAWLELDSDRAKYQVLQDKAAIVRRIFALSAAGNGVTRISQILNRECVPPLAKKRQGTRFQHWTGPELARLLHNINVIGHCNTRGGEVRENLYPAIIDKTLFYTVQDSIRTRHDVGRGRKGAAVHNLLAGLCRCGRCGSPLRFSRGFHNALHCTAAYSKACDAPSFAYDRIETELLSWLLLDFDDEIFESHDSKTLNPAFELQGDIEAKTKHRDNLLNLVMIGSLKSDAAVTLLNKVQEELTALEAAARAAMVPRERIADGAEKNVALFVEHQNAKNGDDPMVLFAVRLKLQEALRQLLSTVIFTTPGEFDIVFNNTKQQRFTLTY